MTRPNPYPHEILLFSPYLVHGGSVNVERDLTRVEQLGSLRANRVFGLNDFLGPEDRASRDSQIGAKPPHRPVERLGASLISRTLGSVAAEPVPERHFL